jgi:hypothetical protein
VAHLLCLEQWRCRGCTDSGVPPYSRPMTRKRPRTRLLLCWLAFQDLSGVKNSRNNAWQLNLVTPQSTVSLAPTTTPLSHKPYSVTPAVLTAATTQTQAGKPDQARTQQQNSRRLGNRRGIKCRSPYSITGKDTNIECIKCCRTT